MSTFEFISVFISIIFGLALAHLLTSAMTHLFRGKLGYERGAYLLLMTTLILSQWWTLFRWKAFQTWTFDAFAVLTLWALTVFAMPVALYPPGEEVTSEIKHRKTFFAVFAAMGALDVAQAAILGQLFQPWYYPLFIGHYWVLAALAVFVKNPVVRNVVATYFAVSLILWLLVVRRFLT
ncbi:MAG: hypothetical protein KF779_18460 [Hyphomonadaceae bacterium]|nr:hypothetical protein [Hyphomonadaceae bacterium]